MVICLELGADLHMAQLMPLPLTVFCFSKIQIGFAFLVPAHLGSPGKRAVKRVCVCVCTYVLTIIIYKDKNYFPKSIGKGVGAAYTCLSSLSWPLHPISFPSFHFQSICPFQSLRFHFPFFPPHSCFQASATSTVMLQLNSSDYNLNIILQCIQYARFIHVQYYYIHKS